MSVTLTVIRGPKKGTRIALRQASSATIGRLPSIEFPLGDANISRKHGYFTLSPDYRLTYTDHSTNGTAIRKGGSDAMEIIKQDTVVLNERDHVLLGSTAIEVGRFPSVAYTRSPTKASSLPKLRRFGGFEEPSDPPAPSLKTSRAPAYVPSNSLEAKKVYDHPFTQLTIARTGRAILREAFNQVS